MTYLVIYSQTASLDSNSLRLPQGTIIRKPELNPKPFGEGPSNHVDPTIFQQVQSA